MFYDVGHPVSSSFPFAFPLLAIVGVLSLHNLFKSLDSPYMAPRSLLEYPPLRSLYDFIKPVAGFARPEHGKIFLLNKNSRGYFGLGFML